VKLHVWSTHISSAGLSTSRCCPPAHADLTSFLRLRDAELVPGGELCVVMVSSGESVFCRPPPGGRAPVLSMALEQVAAEGLLTEEDLGSISVPYYLRTEEEVLQAAGAAAPGSLAVSDVETFFVDFLDGSGAMQTREQLSSVTGMFWAIHEPTIRSQLGGASAREGAPAVDAVVARLKDVFDEAFWTAFRGRRVGATMTMLWMRKSP